MSGPGSLSTWPETTDLKPLQSREPHSCLSAWADVLCKGCLFHIYCWKIPLEMPKRACLDKKIDPCWICCVLLNLLHRLESLWLDLPSARELQFKLCIFPWGGGTLTLEFRASVSVLAVCLGTNYWNILCFSDLIYRVMERKPTGPLQNCGEDN